MCNLPDVARKASFGRRCWISFALSQGKLLTPPSARLPSLCPRVATSSGKIRREKVTNLAAVRVNVIEWKKFPQKDTERDCGGQTQELDVVQHWPTHDSVSDQPSSSSSPWHREVSHDSSSYRPANVWPGQASGCIDDAHPLPGARPALAWRRGWARKCAKPSKRRGHFARGGVVRRKESKVERRRRRSNLGFHTFFHGFSKVCNLLETFRIGGSAISAGALFDRLTGVGKWLISCTGHRPLHSGQPGAER